MKKFREEKNSILILGALSLLAIIILIASLDGLIFEPAKPFAYGQGDNTFSTEEIPSWNGLNIMIAFFATSLIILFFILPSQHKIKFLKVLVWLVLIGTIVYLLVPWMGLEKYIETPQEELIGIARTLSSESTLSPEFQITPTLFNPPQVSPLTSYLVALVLLLFIIGVCLLIVKRKRRRIDPFYDLAEITRSALDEISAGKDLGNAILNSYQRMNIVVADWRGIHRQAGMTPTEFADLLVSVQLPRDAIHRLTLLFELVRYGQKITTTEDIRQAVDSLTAILEYCQSEK